MVNISLQKNQMKTFNVSQFKFVKYLKTINLSNNWIENITQAPGSLLATDRSKAVVLV